MNRIQLYVILLLVVFVPPAPVSGFVVTTMKRALRVVPHAVRSSPRLRRLAEARSSDNDAVPEPTPSAAVTPSSTVKRRRKVATVSPLPTDTESRKGAKPDDITSSTVPVSPTASVNCLMPDGDFDDLQVPPEEFRPSTSLTNGQCFHWKAISDPEQQSASSSAWGTHNATEWIGVVRMPPPADNMDGNDVDRSLVVLIRETPSTTLYRVLYKPSNMSSIQIKEFLWQYFQLDTPLAPLYEEWSAQDVRLKRIAQCIRGVRIIDQDPWECLASFICSSNNNIPRIHKILTAIRREYGTLLLPATAHGIAQEGDIYSFPSLDQLQQQATDEALRANCGIGYRAKYILETMKLLSSLGGESYLHKLKATGTQDQVQEALIQFAGVGRKVADCVALFSLRQPEVIPVDVHVWQICCRDYDPSLRSKKSLTPTVYKQVGDLYRNRFPQKAGWAHSLLFVAELPSFRPILPDDMVQEMDKFREEEQARKKASKTKKKNA